ncbi:MAG: response regulator transcription factor [Nitrospirota bacterium]
MAHNNPAPTSSGQNPSLRVLLVDDNLLFLNRASQWLTKQPGIHIVGQATSGEQGIQQTLLLAPDLVVMDLAMPTMNGHEAAQQIKRRSEATRVILISMHNHETFSENCLLHTDGFVPKDDLYSRLIPLIWTLFPGRGGAALCVLGLGSIVGA